MASQFEPIKIVSFDDKATYRTDSGSELVNAILNLSAPAPSEWADYFNQRWEQHFYMMKRRAHVSGSRLEVCCIPEELQNLIGEFNKIFSDTNQAYAAHVAQMQHDADQKAAAETSQRERLSSIKSKLKFD